MLANTNHPKKCLAFVLSGGGSRGALQVGAMRALLEAGIAPNLLVGTSIGAVNAISLAMGGVNLAGIDALEQGWKKGSSYQLLDPNITKLVFQALLNHHDDKARKKIKNFFISMGITPDLTFKDFKGIQVGLVSADIESGELVIYGLDQNESVLEGLLSSIALPPWFFPYQKGERLLVDGGAFSNLPIEAAIKIGATEIIALDVDSANSISSDDLLIYQYVEKYLYALNRRHASLEMALAEAQGIPVHYIDFLGLANDPTWDFKNYKPLIKKGYEKTRKLIREGNIAPQTMVSVSYDLEMRR